MPAPLRRRVFKPGWVRSPAAPPVIVSTSALRWRYLVFGRVLPGALYAVLGSLQIRHFIDALRASRGKDFFAVLGSPVLLGMYTLFCVIPVAIYIARPMPHRRDGSLEARTAALAGTTMLLFIGAFASGPQLYQAPQALLDGVAVVLTVLTALEVFGLAYLRLNFSIIPEARSLVRSGPYAVVRHPLYAAEIAVAIIWVVSSPHVVLVIALFPFLAIQLLRVRFEESLLRHNFAEYDQYARQTARLIPFVW